MGIGLRFRRGDAWQLARIRTLRPSSIAVATSCPPRSGDRVAIELCADGVTVQTLALVVGVTPPEVATLIGAVGFGARFVDMDPQTQAALHQMAARWAHRSVSAPPPRRHPRYPVRWPIEVGVDGPDTRTPALDISERGLFIASGSEVGVGTPMGLVIRLENGDALHAGACVTRHIPGPSAGCQPTTSGFGVEITVMRPSDAQRYRALVARIARRSRRHIVVWGWCVELAELLAGVGYVVSRVDGERELLGVVERRPDLVVLCAGMRPAAKIATLASVLRHRGITTIEVADADASVVRAHIDALLIRSRS